MITECLFQTFKNMISRKIFQYMKMYLYVYKNQRDEKLNMKTKRSVVNMNIGLNKLVNHWLLSI